MEAATVTTIIVVIVIILVVLTIAVKSVLIIPQAQAAVIERRATRPAGPV